MHFMLLAQRYAPEEVSGAVLATELATDLVARGHRVTFVTGAPHYPAGVVFPGYRNRLVGREWRDGVEIIRTWSYISPHKSFWRRLLNYGSFSLTALLGGLVAERPDAIFCYSPPLPLGLAGWLLARRWRVPWVLRVEDLYPDAAVAAGFLRNRPAIAFFSALERLLYRQASHISLISEGFRANLRRKGVPDAKLSVTPVWADPEGVPLLPQANGFRAAHGLDGHFVVMYAGNLGHTAALDEVIGAAALLRDEPDITFVIVGEGVKKAALQEAARALPNVAFLPFQPREQFAEMLAAADVGLVTLNHDASQTSLPSKTFNIMASGRPIVAVTPAESEIAALVREADCGLNVVPGDPAALAQALRALRADPSGAAALGQRGRAALEAHYARDRCVGDFAALLERVAR